MPYLSLPVSSPRWVSLHSNDWGEILNMDLSARTHSPEMENKVLCGSSAREKLQTFTNSIRNMAVHLSIFKSWNSTKNTKVECQYLPLKQSFLIDNQHAKKCKLSVLPLKNMAVHLSIFRCSNSTKNLKTRISVSACKYWQYTDHRTLHHQTSLEL